jgi:hypothetical protein
VDRQSGRLVHHQKVIVLISNVHGAVVGHDVRGGLVIRQNGHHLSGVDQIAGVNVLSVHQKAVGPALGPADGRGGQAVAAEDGIHPFALLLGENGKFQIAHGGHLLFIR